MSFDFDHLSCLDFRTYHERAIHDQVRVFYSGFEQFSGRAVRKRPHDSWRVWGARVFTPLRETRSGSVQPALSSKMLRRI